MNYTEQNKLFPENESSILETQQLIVPKPDSKSLLSHQDMSTQ